MAVTSMSTCGYLTGDPSQSWLAPAGFDCRIDTSHGLWGFCPTTVIAATDCGLGGYCYDTNTCTSGCGSLSNNPDITTWTCTPSDPQSRYCSMAFLTVGVDQTYEYFHCGPEAATAHYMVSPTARLTSSPLIASSSTLSSSPTTFPSSSEPLRMPTQTPSSFTTQGSMTTAPAQTPAPVASNNAGTIVGGVIGGLATLAVFAVAVLFLLLRYRRCKVDLNHRVGFTQETTPEPKEVKKMAWPPSELPAYETTVELPGDTR